ncbi:hypothetical protein ES705_50382 [subsurface metagenome]
MSREKVRRIKKGQTLKSSASTVDVCPENESKTNEPDNQKIRNRKKIITKMENVKRKKYRGYVKYKIGLWDGG